MKEEVLNLAVNAVDKVIGTSSTYIDEVRFYPLGAKMTTYTYDPLKGIISQTGVDSMMLTSEYDGLGRLAFIKDNEGNIIKSYVYHYKGQ